MSSSPTVKRIMRECKELRQNPPEGIVAGPLEGNVFEWHFTIKGVEDTEFEGGRYHGKLVLPSEYPFKPPDLVMLNKSGRFDVGSKICLNFSGFHPESWQPSWTIRTMLVALRAFMPTPGGGAIGAMEVNKQQRKKFAEQSLDFKCTKCGAYMKELFLDDEAAKKKNSEQEEEDEEDEEDSLEIEESDTENEESSGKKEKKDKKDENSNGETMENEAKVENGVMTQKTEEREENAVVEQDGEERGREERNTIAETCREGSKVRLVRSNKTKKDALLDWLVFSLLVVILAILCKKFFVRFKDQL